MKKLILFIFLAPALLYGQTQKGAVLVNGSLSFAYSGVKEEVDDDSRDDGSQTMINFSPMAGYFVIGGVAVGAGIDWQRESHKNVDQDRTISHSLSLTPFVRYYSQLGPFFHGQLQFGGGTEKFKPEVGPEDIEDDFSLFGFAIGIGYPYFLKEHISIEPMVLFRAQNKTMEGDNIFGAEEVTEKYRGLLIQVGFTYYVF